MLIHLDDRPRVLHPRHRRQQAVDHFIGKFNSYLRAHDLLAGGVVVVALADRAEKAAFLTSSFEIVECGPPAPVGSRGAALQPVVGPDARLLAQYARRYPLNGCNFFAYWQGG